MLNLSKFQFKISLACLLVTFFFSIFFTSGFLNTKKESPSEITKDELVFDFTWVKSYAKKYQELNWFSNNLFLGRNVQKDDLIFTFSQINKQSYNPFEKLIFMLYHLKLFIDYDYADFQQMALFQDDSLRLEFKAFHSIKNEILETLKYRESLKSSQIKSLLELSLIYSQIHLSQKAQDKAYIYEINVDLSKGFFLTINDLSPSFFPTYEGLNLIEKKLLRKLIQFSKLDALFCFDLSNSDLSSCKDVLECAKDENLFDLIFFLYRCYCPGAHAFSLHQDIFYHQKLHKALAALKKSLLVIPFNGPEFGLNHYIEAKRASFGLDSTSITDLVLEPLFLKLYFLDKNDLHSLKKEVTNLSPEHLSLVITYLKDDCHKCTPFFMKILHAFYKHKESQNLNKVFQDSLELFVKVITFLEKDTHIKESVKILDESHLVRALRVNPTILMAKEISVDQGGTIHLENN